MSCADSTLQPEWSVATVSSSMCVLACTVLQSFCCKFPPALLSALHAEPSKTEEIEAKPAIATDDSQAKPEDQPDQPAGAQSATDSAADAKPASQSAADGAQMDVDIDAALPSTTKDGSPTTTNYKLEVKTSEKSAAVSDTQAGDAAAQEATKEVKAEAQVKEGTTEGQEEGSVGKLDVHLTYLWRVHRVNYYVGGKV